MKHEMSKIPGPYEEEVKRPKLLAMMLRWVIVQGIAE